MQKNTKILLTIVLLSIIGMGVYFFYLKDVLREREKQAILNNWLEENQPIEYTQEQIIENQKTLEEFLKNTESTTTINNDRVRILEEFQKNNQ